MDTPFHHDHVSGGAFAPHHHHHQYPHHHHRFHGDYERYPSSSGGGKAGAASTPRKASASSYFSGLGPGPGAGLRPNSDADPLSAQATNHGLATATGLAPMHCVPNPGGRVLSAATNEQEGFVDGFVKALADLHKQNQLIGGGGGGGSGAPGTGGGGVPGTGLGMGGADTPVYTNLSSYSAQNQMGYQVGYQGTAGGPGGRDGALQVVPHAPLPALPLHNSSSSPTPSPVDLETQERIKSERKKLRNRIAASKCRKRKLERIARLEDKVSLLKGFNGELASTAAILKQEVEHLREKVRSHMTRGCQIIITGGGGGGGRRGGEVVEKEAGNPSWGKKSKY